MQQLLLFAPSALRLRIISKLISELEINTMHEASRTQATRVSGGERARQVGRQGVHCRATPRTARPSASPRWRRPMCARARKPSEVEPARARDSAASAAIAEGDAVAPSAAYQPAAE